MDGRLARPLGRGDPRRGDDEPQRADRLDYEVRIEDPQTWTRPWTVAFPLERDADYVLFEYACHEANYAVSNILSGVRAAERRGGP